MQQVKLYIFGHKIQAALILAVLIAGGYYAYGKFYPGADTVRYVTASASMGTITVSVSGNGQVSSSSQIEIKPKVSGAVIRAAVVNGQHVSAGETLIVLDSSEARKAVRDAEANLNSAELSLEKALKPADALSILQAENSLAGARDNLSKLKLSQEINYQKALESRQKSLDNIAKAYEDAFNEISDTFLDLPTIMTKLDDILHGQDIGKAEKSIGASFANTSTLINTLNYATDDRDKIQPFINGAEAAYSEAREAYSGNLINYQNTSRFSERAVIEALLAETIETAKRAAETAKSQTTLLDTWVDLRTQSNAVGYEQAAGKIAEYRTNLTTYNGQVNGHLSSLLSVQRTLQDNKDAVVSAERDLKQMDQNNPLDLSAAEQSVTEKEISLAKLKAGPDPLDIKSQELAVEQRRNALADAQEKLADYTVAAPLDGIAAKVNVKIGDPASSSTAVVTFITSQQIAEVSLNEVDIAKIKSGQKTILTFDAVPNLSISGEVIDIDAIGAVSQGVVSYNVKIGFDTPDERVKSAMSVSAAIITDVKQNVLLVPNAAVKQQTGASYVEIMGAEGQEPERQIVEIGLSNDTMTEIVNGLNEGDLVVTQTITADAGQNSSQQNSSFRIPGITPGGGVIRGSGGGFRQ